MAGGFGRPILTPVPGAPKVDILIVVCETGGYVVLDADVVVSGSWTEVRKHVRGRR